MHTLSLPLVLIVDDEPVIADLAAELFRASGYTALVAGGGQQAWSLFRKWSPDLLFIDWLMPDLDGLELITMIRAVDAHVPIIVSTAQAFAWDASRTRELGVLTVLQKPWTRADILACIAMA